MGRRTTTKSDKLVKQEAEKAAKEAAEEAGGGGEGERRRRLETRQGWSRCSARRRLRGPERVLGDQLDDPGRLA